MAFYNVIKVPYNVSFIESKQISIFAYFFDEASFYIAIVVYCFDIVVNLRTALYSEEGKEIRDPRLIGKQYLKSF